MYKFCPEVAAGLGIPRSPAEISYGDGTRVLEQQSTVVNRDGFDVTSLFIHGAEKTLELVKKEHIKLAVLKDGSPSCGSSTIYDGSFSSLKIRGRGFTTALLEQHGIHVFNENDIQSADRYLSMLLSSKRD